MPKRVLDDLHEYKVRAIKQEGRLKVPSAGPKVVLFARSGFSDDLHAAAAADDSLTLVNLDELVTELDRESGSS
jgi:hypothetical protein